MSIRLLFESLVVGELSFWIEEGILGVLNDVDPERVRELNTISAGAGHQAEMMKQILLVRRPCVRFAWCAGR